MPEVLVAPHPATQPIRIPLSRSVILVAIASFLFSILSIFVGFHHSIFDFHGFRQTQTAISIGYMEHGGAFLRYQTPVLGPPWSIPFEFPLYHKIVAIIVEHAHLPLEETGRAVSIAFFYLCFLPLASSLRRLRYSLPQILAVLALFAVSPLYIFVSRLFMIESTALFLSLMYVDMIFALVIGDKPWRYRYMCLAALFGSLAGVVKITTFLPFALLGAAIAAWQIWKQHGSLTRSCLAATTVLCGLVPVALTLWWTRFADAHRAQNPMGAFVLSSKGIFAAWNFGTLAERLHPANYVHFLHAVAGQAGSLPLLVLLALVHAAVIRRLNIAALASLSLYIITPMIFFNLHLVHEYYPYSSAIFLLVSAGMLIADLLALPGRRSWLGFAFLVALIAACIVRYRGHYYQIQRSDSPGSPEIAALVDRTTTPGDVIVITGLDWSPELPYQSHRRAIMDPGALGAFSPDSIVPLAAVIQDQGAQTIPEMIVCNQMRGTDRARRLLDLLDIQSSTALHADDCDIYLRTLK